MATAKTIRISGALMLATAFASVPTDAAQISRSNCAGQSFSFTTSTSFASTESQTFVDIPETAVSITIPGTTNACVLVAFSAQAFTNAIEGINFRAVRDGSLIAAPGELSLSQDTTTGHAHAFFFAFPSVAPGTHIIKMQFRSPGGAQVDIGKHTTVVHHR